MISRQRSSVDDRSGFCFVSVSWLLLDKRVISPASWWGCRLEVFRQIPSDWVLFWGSEQSPSNRYSKSSWQSHGGAVVAGPRLGLGLAEALLGFVSYHWHFIETPTHLSELPPTLCLNFPQRFTMNIQKYINRIWIRKSEFFIYTRSLF